MVQKIIEGSDFISSNNFSIKDNALVKFYNIKENLIFENQYSSDKTIEEVFKNFFEKNPEQHLRKFLNIDKYFNKNNIYFYIKKKEIFEKIENYDVTISSFIYKIQDTVNLLGLRYYNSLSGTTDMSNNMSLIIYIKYKHRYKHIIEKIEEYISKNTYLIGKPIINKLKYYLYNKFKKELKIIKNNKEDIYNSGINNFSIIDSYCNIKNYLYIYEGASKYDYIDSNKFIKIDLINNKINLISNKFPKRILHSMIFIPECYIFIIGGKNTKEVITYKIKEGNKEYKKYPYLLPYELIEPSLIFIDNKYLYIFENSKLDFNILRTNLINITAFENIKLKNKNNNLVNQKFFGVVRNKNSILFLGGQMINTNNNFINKCYEYHYDSNKLVISKREFKSIDLIEKTFIPLGGDIYMQLTEFKKKNKYEPKMIFFDGREQEVEKSEKETIDNK